MLASEGLSSRSAGSTSLCVPWHSPDATCPENYPLTPLSGTLLESEIRSQVHETWPQLQRYLSGCSRRNPGNACLPCSLQDWDVLLYSASLGLLFFTFSKKPRPTSSPESLPGAPMSSSRGWFCFSALSLPSSCMCCFHPSCAFPASSVPWERLHCGGAAACYAPARGTGTTPTLCPTVAQRYGCPAHAFR